MVKDHRSDSIHENTYIDELDKETYQYIKADLSEEDIEQLNKYFGLTEELNSDNDSDISWVK